MAKEYATENPAFTRSGLTGVPANHSSTERSVASPEHAQSDDDLQNVPPPQDPNISGTPETSQLHPWRAGQLSAWQENDDYREFFEAGHVACPSIKHRSEYPLHDGDYDDNRGIPLGIGEIHGLKDESGGMHLSHGDLPTADEFPLGPVIRRRI